MPGHMYDGRPVTEAKNGDERNSLAFCEGMHYRAGGTAVQRPKADGTIYHPAGSEALAAWERGWDAAEAAAGGPVDKGTRGPCAGTESVPV